jgi:hypothetical protein
MKLRSTAPREGTVIGHGGGRAHVREVDGSSGGVHRRRRDGRRGHLLAARCAGEVAGAAVWLSFLIAGAVALLQGYSFAKFGARYPSAAGLLEYVVRGLGNGHVTGIIAW